MSAQVWPQAGQSVTVKLPGSSPLLCAVVDDVAASELLVLREPFREDGSGPDLLPLGSMVLLRWTSPAGSHELTASLASIGQQPVTTWVLVPVATPHVAQRREFSRASDALRARLHRADGSWNTIVYDLGEGGARCVVPSADDLCAGDQVELHVALEGVLPIDAVILSVEPSSGPGATVRLQFPPLGRLADIIRRRVLQQQRRARAVERG